MNSLGRIRIIRGSESFGRQRNIELYVDGKSAGLIPSNVTREFLVSPGIKEVYVKMDWYRSETRKLDIKVNSIHSYKVGLPNGVQQWFIDLVLNPETFFSLNVAPTNKSEEF